MKNTILLFLITTSISVVLSTSEETCSDTESCKPYFAKYSFKDWTMPYALFGEQLAEVDGVEIHAKQGAIPGFLHGSLYRVGAAMYSLGNRRVNNLCDGLAKVNRWTFNSQTGSVKFSAKFLKSETYNRTMAQQEIIAMRHMGEIYPDLTLFEKLKVFFWDHYLDNNNIAMWKLGEAGVTATTESLNYIDVGYDTLDFIRRYIPKASDRSFLELEVVSASHFSRHPITGNSINYKLVFPMDRGIWTGMSSPVYNFYEYVTDKDGAVVADFIGAIPVAKDDTRVVHSIGATENFVILPRFSVTLIRRDPIHIGANLLWDITKPTVIDILSIKDKSRMSFKFNPYEAQHTINAFERKNANNEQEVVIDFPTRVHPAAFNRSMYDFLNTDCFKKMEECTDHSITDRLSSNQKLTRFILNIDTGVGTEYTFPIMWSPEEGTGVEFPIINPSYSGIPYCYAYFTVLKHDANNAMGLMKVDMCRETSIGWEEKNKFPAEPIFVARKGSLIEDDGVILSPVFDVENNSTSLYIWDAKNLEVLTVLDIPIVIPFTLHGVWIDDVGL